MDRGPYLIAEVLAGARYMLCNHYGNKVEGGNVDGVHLVAA